MAKLIGLGLVFADDGWDHHMDWDGGWWVVMVIGMVLFWALVIVGIVWLVRELSGGRGGRPGREPSALELLDRRLADGTISPADYHERRAMLEKSQSAGKGSGS